MLLPSSLDGVEDPIEFDEWSERFVREDLRRPEIKTNKFIFNNIAKALNEQTIDAHKMQIQISSSYIM